MEFSIEKTEGLERRISVTVPAEHYATKLSERIKGMSTKVSIPGFRKGKIPLKVVEQHYGKQLRSELNHELIQSSYGEAVEKEKLRPASRLSIESLEEGKGKDLVFTAVFEVYPEVKIQGLDKIEIDQIQVEITDGDIDKMLQRLQSQYKSWDAVSRVSQKGDQLIVDFSGTIDGVIFAGGEGKDVSIVLGENGMIKDFEDALFGVKKEQNIDIDVQFPDDYHVADLAAKKAKFAIVIKEVNEAVLPEIDAEFSKKLGIGDGDVSKLKEEVKTSMEREVEVEVKQRTKAQLMDSLLSENPMELPRALVEEETAHMAHGGANGQQKHQHDDNCDHARFEDAAKKRLRLGLLLAEIIKQQTLKVEPVDLRKAVEILSASYEKPEEMIRYYYSKPENLAQIENRVLEDQAVSWLLSQVKVNDQNMAYEKLFGEVDK